MAFWKKGIVKFLVLLIIVYSLGPFSVDAGENFEISGWIPYWRSQEGVFSVLPNVSNFAEVNPFIYTVRKNGSLFEASSLLETEWLILRSQTKEKNIRFIPTVMWSNSDTIHAILSDPQRRTEHIRAIAWEVNKYNLDGIDIDYEAKYAKTRPFFSAFLMELQEAIGFNKWIMCTIEARTPLDSRYSNTESIPVDIEYANDFSEINKYCDRVRIMAYDQGRIDLKLNKSNDHPYIPVADGAWVEKVIRLAAEEIQKDKLVIGVPTYGYEYDMFLTENATGFPKALDSGISGQTGYSRLWSFNPAYALAHAEKLNLTPNRNSAGELMLVYPAENSSDPEVIPLTFATRVMSWSDAEAIRQKAKLAEELGVRGIALFKIDGGQDPDLWNVLSQYKGTGEFRKQAKIANETVLNISQIPESDLEFGAKGEEVRNLQKILNVKGYKVSESGPGSPGNETTIFGYATKNALIRFQKENNIMPAAGYYGPKTRQAIK